MPCLYAFVYCTIPLLLHYYVDRRMYCTTDLYHSNSTSLKPQSIADTFIWSFAVVNQHNSTTANQHIIETMLLPICIELLSWLSGSVLHCFSKPLVRWACKQARMYLLKIAFPYWSNVCFGCDWHILTSELALLSVSQKDENPALFPVISIRCRLAHRPIPFLLLGSLGIGKRCFESRNNNTCSNPFIDGFLVLSKAQQGVLRVTRRLFGYCRKGSSKVCFE